MNVMGADYEVAERYAIFSRPENTGKAKKKFIDAKTGTPFVFQKGATGANFVRKKKD